LDVVMRIARALKIAATVVLVAMVGCARPSNPWVYAEPPAVSLTAAARPVDHGRTVIAVATFTNPDLPQLDWPGVGAELSRAMRRSLYNDTDFEVRIAPEIEQAASNPAFLDKTSGQRPVEVDFVVIGQVTDFHHTAGLPKDVSRWGLIARRKEAVVAIEWRVVDVRAHRVVATDHTYGTAKASGKKSIPKLYEGIDVSTYLFWNTPLGRASHEAIDNTIERMRAILPTFVGTRPTITAVLSARKVLVQGGWDWGLAEGQEYYIVIQVEGDDSPEPVRDVDTGLALVVKITDVNKGTAEAWLLGKPAPGVDIRGAVLLRQPGSPSDELASSGP
jgi:curli biogenesis system outer membrane secretion channel CsgG